MAGQSICRPVDHMCRICAEEGCEQFIPIFEHPGLELSLSSKIENHLPIKVDPSDNLPHQVCEPCICKLNICHNLVQTAKAADLKFHNLLTNSSDETICEKTPVVERNHLQCSEVAVSVAQFQLDNGEIHSSKKFELPNESVLSEKALDDVQFEIAITESIEIVKSIDSNQQLHIEGGDSTVVNTDHVFELSGENVNNKLNNLINDSDEFRLSTVSLPVELNDEDDNDKSEENKQEINESSISEKLLNEDNNELEESCQKTGESEQKLSCPQCGKVCKSAIGLDVHISTHSNVAPFLCDLCGKNFKHVNSLYCHKRTHLDDSLKKKHPCAICNKSFRSKFVNIFVFVM